MKRLLWCGAAAMAAVQGFGATQNLAFRRAVYQSSAADFDRVGHLVTDGKGCDVPLKRTVVTAELAEKSPAAEKPAKAIDGVKDTKWVVFSEACWLEVSLPEAAVAAQYAVMTANDEPGRDPKVWTVLGSNDGKSFAPLATMEDPKFHGRHEKKTWKIEKPSAYRIYRLAIAKNGGGLAQDRKTPCTQLAEFDLLNAQGQSLLRGGPANGFESRWVSRTGRDEWLKIDLGRPCRVDKIEIDWAKGGEAAESKTEVSEDGRYVTIRCMKAKGDVFGIDEVRVLGSATARGEPGTLLDGATARGEPGTQSWRLAPARDVAATGEELTRGAFDDSAWLPAVVPGTVVASYLKAGVIPDMNIADNQLMISESFFKDDFWYRHTFTVPAKRKGVRTWLDFDAINWKAEVYLNGHALGTIEGAFLRKRFDITPYVVHEGENRLAVKILKNEHPGAVSVQDRHNPGPNGGVLGRDNPTIHASIGWDWMPTVRGRNIGIYRDVKVTYSRDVRLSDGWVVTELDVAKKDFSKAEATVRVRATNAAEEPVTTTLEATLANETLTREVTLAAGETREVTIGTVTIRNPKLWWPATYGAQPLYLATIVAKTDGQVSNRHTFQFGVRKFTYSDGKPLQIFCNGTRIVCRGGNWGMDDANLAAKPADYDTKVRLHAEANLTMIRNWVGMTNSDDFYKACDKYGVLVWDDFWLANPSDGPDPKDVKMFLANARDKVLKVRHHASIPLYCARNEGMPPKNLVDALPKLVKELDGTRHYIPHSASGTVSGFGPYSVRDPKWYFANAPETLHSERGQPNVPEIESMRTMLGPDHLWPMDDVWGMHDYTGGGAQGCNGFTSYVRNSFGEPKGLDEFTRFAQAVAYENHKAMFESVYAKGGNGILMWMSQSAWPSMVWQTYDYWHDVNGGYAGAKVGNQARNVILDQNTKTFLAVNATPEPLTAEAKVVFYDTTGRELLVKTAPVALAPTGKAELFALPQLETADGILLIRATLGAAENFTWINVKKDRDYKALRPLLATDVRLAEEQIAEKGSGVEGRVTVVNASGRPQLLVRVQLVDEKGDRVLPVHWSENYLNLLPGERRTVSFSAPRAPKGSRVASTRGVGGVCATARGEPGTLPDWAFGPFVRPAGVNPVIAPNKDSSFFCPMRKRDLKWEESDTFNPAATVKDGKIVVLYRAEDNTFTGVGSRTSRLGYAETTDGVTMKRDPAPVLYPCEDGFKDLDWEGGCEDPRLAMTEDGLYVLTYTSWNKRVPRLSIATSRDLTHWTKHGLAFGKADGGKHVNRGCKSAAIVQAKSRTDPSKYVITKVNGKYLMYWGEAAVEVATSDNLIDWQPLGIAIAPRRGRFDSALTEVGPAAILTEKGIVVFYNGKNQKDDRADPKYPRGVYAAGQVLFDAANPKKALARLDEPYFWPEADFEKTGQYKDGTVFTEGLVFYKGKWHLYYGCADSFVGYAVWDPKK